MSKFRPSAPFSTLVAAAQASRIPIEGIDSLADGTTLNPGDSATAIVTLFEKGGRRTQWLLFLQTAQPGDEPLPKPRAPMSLYTSRGNKVEYLSSPVLGSLRTIGPFVEIDSRRKQPKIEDETDRFVLDQGFLALGFDRAAATILRFRKLGIHGHFNFSPQPFSQSDIARGRELAEKVHLTDEEERALGGGVPALISYLNILQHASGLESIAMKIVARPSIWSIVRHAGVSAGIFFRQEKTLEEKNEVFFGSTSASQSGNSGSLANSASFYHIPLEMQLNEQPALYTTLITTAPRPPLLLCGGVVGLVAEKPGDKETYLTLRIISARRAARNDQ